MRRILIAGSDAVMARWFVVSLSPLARERILVADGARALDCLADHRFDLVVAHRPLRLPDAPQLLSMTRNAGLDVPFLLVAAEATAELRRLVARCAPAACVADPIGRKALLAVARGLLQSERRRIAQG
jgi:DNA-binding response OmpR family regulator